MWALYCCFLPFPRPGSTLRSCIGCFSEHSVSMRGDLLCATCLLSAWCPWSDLLNLTSTTPFVCPHMHCFQNNPPSNPGWFYPLRKTLIPPLSASFTFNKRVFSITAFIRGHKRDTNPTPCLRLSPSLSSHYCIDAVTSLGDDVTGSVELEHPCQRQGDNRAVLIASAEHPKLPFRFPWVPTGSHGWRKRRYRYKAPAGGDFLSPSWRREAVSRGSARPGGEQRRWWWCPRSWTIKQTSTRNRANSRYWHCRGRAAFFQCFHCHSADAVLMKQPLFT